MTIELSDTQREYVSIKEARGMSGLRIILAEFTIPGPWFESCKGVFHVKGLPYVAVRNSNPGATDVQVGIGGTQSDLVDWTAQSSAPVVIWNDERPRTVWNDQLNLAERLSPEPPLVPEDMEQRVRMFGLANELLGENGLVWNKRFLMVSGGINATEPGTDQRMFWEHLGAKYDYTEAGAAQSAKRIAGIVTVLEDQLASQRAKGHRYLVGDRLSALDIYWACACGILDPMPPDRCPMFDGFRGIYGNDDPDIDRALTDDLRGHRDFIYDEHLELPIRF